MLLEDNIKTAITNSYYTFSLIYQWVYISASSQSNLFPNNNENLAPFPSIQSNNVNCYV